MASLHDLHLEKVLSGPHLVTPSFSQCSSWLGFPGQYWVVRSSQIGSGGLHRDLPNLILYLSSDYYLFPCFSRPHLGSVPDFRFSVADGHVDAYSTSAVLRRPQKGRLAALRDEPSKARPPLAERHLFLLDRLSVSFFPHVPFLGFSG